MEHCDYDQLYGVFTGDPYKGFYGKSSAPEELSLPKQSEPNRKFATTKNSKPKAVIPLAKAYDKSKIDYPGFLSVKLDGVPIRCDVTVKNGIIMGVVRRTRQGLVNVSTKDQFELMLTSLATFGAISDGVHTFIAEVTHEKFTSFKDVNGIVRKKTPQKGLVLNLFDYQKGNELASFEDRLEQLKHMLNIIKPQTGFNALERIKPPAKFNVIPQHFVNNQHEFDKVSRQLLNENNHCEGLIYKEAYAAGLKPGLRHWGYQKIVKRPSMDLVLLSYEEARCAKTGQGKKMVGRINCECRGKVLGVSPGAMSHEERTREWAKYADSDQSNNPHIVKVEYKKDPAYQKPREATFVCWRTDKSEPSYE